MISFFEVNARNKPQYDKLVESRPARELWPPEKLIFFTFDV